MTLQHASGQCQSRGSNLVKHANLHKESVGVQELRAASPAPIIDLRVFCGAADKSYVSRYCVMIRHYLVLSADRFCIACCRRIVAQTSDMSRTSFPRCCDCSAS